METEKTELELLEQEMKKLNLDIINKDQIDETKRYMVVEVDIDCEVNLEFMNDLALRKKVMRGNHYYVVLLKRREGTLTMKIGVELPNDFVEVFKSANFDQLGVVATTFPDLCWIHSNGTTPQTLDEVTTKIRIDAMPGDLTWILPSKFVDDFVEMMHTLNQGIIGGLMQDAIIYGPIILEKDELFAVI